MYKGSVPRGAGASRYGSRMEEATKCEGAEIRGPLFGATRDLVRSTTAYAELIALCCVLAGDVTFRPAARVSCAK